MCIGLEERHIKCGHPIRFSIRSSCGDTAQTGIPCLKDQCSFVEGRYILPRLCATCYQMEERTIFIDAREDLLHIKQYVLYIRRALRTPNLDWMMRRHLEEFTTQVAVWLNENRRMLEWRLFELRQLQAIWYYV